MVRDVERMDDEGEGRRGGARWESESKMGRYGTESEQSKSKGDSSETHEKVPRMRPSTVDLLPTQP